MKAVIICILLAICYHEPVLSQVIKLNNGLLVTKTTNKKGNFMKENITTYALSLGVDYWEHNYYYLSSEIGYIKLGAKESNAYMDNKHTPVLETWNNLQFDTTFRVRYPMRAFFVYLGLGPKIDILLGEQKFTSSFLQGIPRRNRVNFGTKTEAGVACDLKKIRIGLNYSYNFNFNSIARGLYNYQHMLMFSLGYFI